MRTRQQDQQEQQEQQIAFRTWWNMHQFQTCPVNSHQPVSRFIRENRIAECINSNRLECLKVWQIPRKFSAPLASWYSRSFWQRFQTRLKRGLCKNASYFSTGMFNHQSFNMGKKLHLETSRTKRTDIRKKRHASWDCDALVKYTNADRSLRASANGSLRPSGHLDHTAVT